MSNLEIQGLQNIVEESLRHPDAVRLAIADGLLEDLDLNLERPSWHDDCLPVEADGW